MASEKFTCPNCGTTLTKSPMAHILGNAGGFIGFGGTRSVRCPACGGPIDTMKMIEGAYDVKEPSGCAVLLVLGAIIAALAWIFG